jgi:hypothetical protein
MKADYAGAMIDPFFFSPFGMARWLIDQAFRGD